MLPIKKSHTCKYLPKVAASSPRVDLRPVKFYERCPPAACLRRRVFEARNQTVIFEQGSDPPFQGAASLAVNDADGKDSGGGALSKIVVQKGGNFRRPEGVQVQNVFNGQSDRVQGGMSPETYSVDQNGIPIQRELKHLP
jgi:hypothetical protein